MNVTLLRHATCTIEIDQKKLLLDPIFYAKDTLAPANGGRMVNNPTVELNYNIDKQSKIDAILLTHPHRDHFDISVLGILGEDIPIICPDYYAQDLIDMGCKNVISVKDKIDFQGITIKLTIAHHGLGEIEELMNKSFGYILCNDIGKKLYITGDTVWCEEVESILKSEAPDWVLAFSGNATLNGHQITLNKKELFNILSYINEHGKLLPIHLEAWNHCTLTRKELKGIDNRIYVLNDSESITL